MSLHNSSPYSNYLQVFVWSISLEVLISGGITDVNDCHRRRLQTVSLSTTDQAFRHRHTSLTPLLKNYNIESKVGLATSKYKARQEEIIDISDLHFIVTANGNSQIFATPRRYRVAGEIPAGLQGEPAYLFTIDNIKDQTER